jgi:hypothetical protein
VLQQLGSPRDITSARERLNQYKEGTRSTALLAHESPQSTNHCNCLLDTSSAIYCIWSVSIHWSLRGSRRISLCCLFKLLPARTSSENRCPPSTKKHLLEVTGIKQQGEPLAARQREEKTRSTNQRGALPTITSEDALKPLTAASVQPWLVSPFHINIHELGQTNESVTPVLYESRSTSGTTRRTNHDTLIPTHLVS